MTPDLQNALTTFVNQLITLVNSGTAQLPAVLQDIVAYKLFDAWFGIGIGALILVIALVLWFFTICSDWDFPSELTGVGAIIATIGGGLTFFGGIYQVYYVTHFPRLVILDYLKRLV